MADAEPSDLNDDEVAEVQEETSTCPCMPHLMYSATELDARYPPLVAPPDEGLVDVTDDRRDGVYQHGLKLASEIRAQVTAQGRRRRPLGLVGSTPPPKGLVARIPQASPATDDCWARAMTSRDSGMRRPRAWIPEGFVGSVDDTHRGPVPAQSRDEGHATRATSESQCWALFRGDGGQCMSTTGVSKPTTLPLGLASLSTFKEAGDDPHRQPEQRPSLRLWRSDRMRTSQTTTGSVGRADARHRFGTDSHSDSPVFLSRSFAQIVDPDLTCFRSFTHPIICP